ncbi:MAG: hypothetical protein Q4B79_01200 [Moraxella sp.]|uniref:hypothetical protein n=1 Tax=Moraxella sp. TaxID=479 RepID=UPI0026DAD55E|nr:hypothetical protein [Moraxella sp.]MDO4449562.1 hypothetical protein [Moraxella sp.]
MNKELKDTYPNDKVIKNYILFGTLVFNFPIFVYFLLIIIFRSDTISIIIMATALFFGILSTVIFMAIVGFVLINLQIKITKLSDYVKPFLAGFLISLVGFFLFNLMIFPELYGLIVSLFLALFVGIISAILAKFILPKS